MKTIIIPILPGKTEAWRRLLQELCGSRREEFAEWCAQRGIKDLELSLCDTAGAPAAIISVQVWGKFEAAAEDTHFARWLSKQLHALHGLDLPAVLTVGPPAPLFKL